MAQSLMVRRRASVTVLVLTSSSAAAVAAAATIQALDARWPVQWLMVGSDDQRSRDHLRSTVARLARADLPVVLWLPAGLPRPDEPELDWVDHIVIDSRSAVSSADLTRHLLELAERLPLTDLAWLELAPWRELLAGLFEGPVFGPFLRDVKQVRVEGGAAPRRLLAGWLASRLGVADRTEVVASERVAIEIVAEHDQRRGRFSVTWSGEAPLVDARAEIAGGPSQHRRWRPGEPSETRLLGRVLVRLEVDERYVEALTASTRTRDVRRSGGLPR